MRARTLGVSVGVVLLGAGCAWIAGVSGDAELVVSPDATDSATSAQDAVHEADGRSSADAPLAEAGNDATELPESGLPPDRGRTQCGTRTCTLANSVCCYQAASSPACTDKANPSCSGVLAECDEGADCDSGVCCVTDVRTYGVETACKTACGPGEPRACRVSNECSGRTCVAWGCAGTVVETCGGGGGDGGCVP